MCRTIQLYLTRKEQPNNPNEDDADGDGQSIEEGDCDDNNPDVYLGAEEEYYDGVDANCDGQDDYDADGDGYGLATDFVQACVDASRVLDNTDCNDDPEDGYSINSEADEICDGIDNDCDGDFDDNDLLENLKFFYTSINKSKPDSVKGSFIKKVTIASTMGVGLEVNLTSLR